MNQTAQNDVKEYDLMGFRLKVRNTETTSQANSADQDSSSDYEVSPSKVIELVQEKIKRAQKKSPGLSDTEKMIMIALELAEENIKLKHVSGAEVEKLKNYAEDALRFISEIEASQPKPTPDQNDPA